MSESRGILAAVRYKELQFTVLFSPKEYLKFLLKVSTNFSKALMGEWDTFAQKLKKPLKSQIKFSRVLLKPLFCLQCSFDHNDHAKILVIFQHQLRIATVRHTDTTKVKWIDEEITTATQKLVF